MMMKLHGLRCTNVQVTIDGWRLRLWYGDTRVEFPWEELGEWVELVRPAVARIPVAVPWPLVAVMRPGHCGTQPEPLRLHSGNRVGLNLRLTPKEAAALASLLARQSENSRRAAESTADDGAK
ncbi:hypothetical protein [Streptomyces cacaoi]|uniref:hypothetical protein n=1 Tax=Streptomyces cacaoi TaxID=1898 RepID=UPI003748A25B